MRKSATKERSETTGAGEARGHARRAAFAASPLLPFARIFYVWTDDAGTEHEVLQAGRGAKRPSHACTLCSGWQWPNTPTFTPWRPHCNQANVPKVLDDTDIVRSPGALADALWDHARVQLNQDDQCSKKRNAEPRCNQTLALPRTCGSGLGPCPLGAKGSLLLCWAAAPAGPAPQPVYRVCDLPPSPHRPLRCLPHAAFQTQNPGLNIHAGPRVMSGVILDPGSGQRRVLGPLWPLLPAGGWAPRQRRGRAHMGRRPAPALGRLATRASRLCLQRRAGWRQTGLPTNAAPTQRRTRSRTKCDL